MRNDETDRERVRGGRERGRGRKRERERDRARVATDEFLFEMWFCHACKLVPPPLSPYAYLPASPPPACQSITLYAPVYTFLRHFWTAKQSKKCKGNGERREREREGRKKRKQRQGSLKEIAGNAAVCLQRIAHLTVSKTTKQGCRGGEGEERGESRR